MSQFLLIVDISSSGVASALNSLVPVQIPCKGLKSSLEGA